MEHKNSIEISNFDGPIDLLYSLIKDKQLNIMEVNLEELAISYLKIIDSLKNNDIDLASEYLVMAASLLQIKAKALLKSPHKDEKIEATKAEILKKLVEHQKFKMVASNLRGKELERSKVFIKMQNDLKEFSIEDDESRLDGKSDAVKLIMALRKMFERTHAAKLRQTTIEQFNLSPAERRLELIALFKSNPHANFKEVFSVPSLNHFVVTMVTVLDMALKQELIIEQVDQSSDISIKKGRI